MREDDLFRAYGGAAPPAGPTPPVYRPLAWLPQSDLTGRQAAAQEEIVRIRQADTYPGMLPCRQPHCMNLLREGLGSLYCRDHRVSARTGPAR